MKSFSKEIAGTAGVCLQGVHLWEGGREGGGRSPGGVCQQRFDCICNL